MSASSNGLPRPAVGIAYSGYVDSFLASYEDRLDYVEVPYELLQHDPGVIDVRSSKPVVLHCASLSVGGTAESPRETLEAIQGWVERTGTPWIGEHLAYVTASRAEAGPVPQPYAPGEPYNIGYTVSPPMNGQTLDRVVRRLEGFQREFPVPLLVENSPLYFQVPTSTMSQTEFLRELCARSDAGLLLDLAHFYITSETIGFDPLEELENLPLEAVVEVHISGVDSQSDGLWDDHATVAPDIVYQMLARVLERVTPKAVTLEYNWSIRFPHTLLAEELARTREQLDRA